MTVLVDTAQVPAADREESVREALGARAAMMDVRFVSGPEDISCQAWGWQLGETYLIWVTANGLRLTRSARSVRVDGREIVSFGFLGAGASWHTQSGMRHENAGGNVSILDFTLPWDVGFKGPCSMGSMVVAADTLNVPVDVIRRASRSPMRSPVHNLFSNHLLNLSREAESVSDPRHAPALGSATIELARAFIAGADPAAAAARDIWHETLQRRVTAYLRQHLADHDLCAQQIARAHHVSVRNLYSTWAQNNDISLQQWIICRRLERAANDLAARDLRHITITSIAQKWGFADSTHFSRRFRHAYGISPREWRQIHQHISGELSPGTAYAHERGRAGEPLSA